jgi:hypothetical protein
MSLMKRLMKGTRVRGPKVPKATINMKSLTGMGSMGIPYGRKRSGTRPGSRASFKKMLRNV